MRKKLRSSDFKTASHDHCNYRVIADSLDGIITVSKDVSVPGCYKKTHFNEYALPYKEISDIIRNGNSLYYVVYSDCYMSHGRYHAAAYACFIYSPTKKAVREYIMDGRKVVHGYGDGRCINCIMEVNKMHPYEITQVFNQVLPNTGRYDEDRYFASYIKDFPECVNPAYIEELCREYEAKYHESVDAWKYAVVVK